MPDPEFVSLDDGVLIADEVWLNGILYGNGNGNGTAPVDSSWTAEPLSSVPDEPPAAPDLGGIGFLYPGRRHVFSGPQESAKTLAAYLCGLAVIRAGTPVVLLDLEMGRYDAKRRFVELGATAAELDSVHYVEPQARATSEAIAALIALEPGLVILDAVAGAFQVEGLDDNSRRDVETWAAGWIVPFWRAKIATLVLDHVTKNAETRGAYAIGSERKVGSADVHIGFETITAIKRGAAGRYKVVTHKDRGGFLKRGKLFELALVSDPETHLISAEWQKATDDVERDYFRPTHLMEKVSRWLELQLIPVSRNDVEKSVAGANDALRTALDVLTLEGYIEESAGARRARLVESIRSYREDLDGLISPDKTTSPDFAGLRRENLAETTSPLRLSPLGVGEANVGGENGEATSPDPDSELPF